MSIFEMAKKYYPRLWSEERIKALLDAGKLTEEEYETVVGDSSTGSE